MIQLSKFLLKIIIALIPITIFSFFKKETIFYEKAPETIDTFIPVLINDDIVNIPLEDYIIGVVAGEMPALFELEALKSQAIASRTYAINHQRSNEYITATTDDQVYLTDEQMQEKWQDKYDQYYQKIKRAVTETSGLIMTYNHQPIKSYYYSMSNGYTESSLNVFNEQNDYLTIIPSPFDENNSKTVSISKNEFCEKLSIDCQNISISNIEKNKSNRISHIKINNKTFTGIEIRKILSLRSTDFTIEILPSSVTITTKGYGHGVGMSQYGSNNMAKLGYTYEEILKYYYQNIEITSI